jgi:hypothetical protein
MDADYQEVRQSWRTKIKGINEAIVQLLDMYFEKLMPILFDTSASELRYPKSSGT